MFIPWVIEEREGRAHLPTCQALPRSPTQFHKPNGLVSLLLVREYQSWAASLPTIVAPKCYGTTGYKLDFVRSTDLPRFGIKTDGIEAGVDEVQENT